jgi:hypothetical protein
MPSAIFYTTEMVAYGMGHRGASSRPGVIVGPRPSDRGSARRCRAWRRRRCTSQHPTSPSTSLTSYVGQEIIVANNTVCFSCPTSWSPGRPGSRDVPVMRLALSEFHYCRHNSCSVGLLLSAPLQTLTKPADGRRRLRIVLSDCCGHSASQRATAQGGARIAPQATTGVVWARNPGYHWRNVASHSPFNTRVRIWSSKWAPRLLHRICCFFTMRLLTT